MRTNKRHIEELRPITFARHYTKYAEGSVLVSYGDTKVLCTASVTEGVPGFLKGKGQGWVTAEYSMLPRATHDRTSREASRGKQTGRTLEIQRLIGRAVRGALDLSLLGEYTITLDCDVIQADGGTRTAAISGACVALVDAIDGLIQRKCLTKNPFKHLVAAVSVGIVNGEARLDLEYTEDSACDTDMNVVMNDVGGFLEVQGTAEGKTFSGADLEAMLTLAKKGIHTIIKQQKQTLGML